MKYERWQMKMIDEDDRREDMVWMKDTHERWQKKEDKRHAERHKLFPEDDILDIITISRYNYHK